MQARLRHRSLLLAALLGFAFGCDGRYTLGDVVDGAPTGDAGHGGEGGQAEAGSPSTPAGGASGDTTGGDGDAGAAGGNAADAIRISPSGLPEARLNRAYLVQFGANGGVEPYTFRLADGALPVGLALDAAGQLSGTPLAEGQFDFELEVKDAENAHATAAFRLSVGRSRWLATSTFPASSSTQTLLSLTDLRDPAAESIRIESASAHSMSFSPDGRWLTYHCVPQPR